MSFAPLHDPLSLEKLTQFLHENQLPYADVKTEGNFFIGYFNRQQQLVGCGGLELYPHDALLRSLAVDKRYRGKNLGTQITNLLIAKAKELSIHSIFLLTETAHDYFEKKGFMDIPRDEAPEAILKSTEFTSVCPTSASCMVFKLH
jgi:amino-acid N-acetyltransferase